MLKHKVIPSHYLNIINLNNEEVLNLHLIKSFLHLDDYFTIQFLIQMILFLIIILICYNNNE